MHPIERYRKVQGWSRMLLARRVGVHTQTVRGWEQGAVPRMDRIQVLAELFGVGYRRFLDEIVAWRTDQPHDEAALAARPPETAVSRLASDFNRAYDLCGGSPSPAVLATFAALFERLDPAERRAFRIRVIGHVARGLSPVVLDPLTYAGHRVDDWFAESRPPSD